MKEQGKPFFQNDSSCYRFMEILFQGLCTSCIARARDHWSSLGAVPHSWSLSCSMHRFVFEAITSGRLN